MPKLLQSCWICCKLIARSSNASIDLNNSAAFFLEGIATLHAGNDTLEGGDGNDRLFGDVFNLLMSYAHGDVTKVANLGDDLIYGGEGTDYIAGDAQGVSDHVTAGQNGGTTRVYAGSDTIFTGNGGGSVFGDFQSVNLQYGTDFVYSGNDIVISGHGNDRIWGDAAAVNIVNGTFYTGADLFVFAANSGLDTIYDFEVGKDRLDVSALGYTDFASIMSLIEYDAITGHTTIDFDGTSANADELLLENVALLSAGDFLFA